MITSCLPISINEEKRLKTLKRYPIDFSLSEREFDEITQLAANICNTPIAFISIVELDKQWFKSKIGFNLSQSPRNISFCHHTIMTDEMMEVPDTLRDSRFASNPLVVGQPFIRFYAGVPLITANGYKLGSLCVVDYEPRKLTEKQSASLKHLSRIVMNLFELRRSQKELREEKQRADDASKAKADFLSTMSHEIRTPLNGVIGLTHILMQDNPHPGQMESLKSLKFSAENLMTIVNDILDFSKIEAGHVKFSSVNFDLDELIQNIKHVNTPIASKKGLKFILDKNYDDNLILSGDPNRLIQVLNNLISNAIKFTEHGSVRLSVSSPSDRRIRFTVKDTGIGISSEDQQKIFSRFSQVGSEARKKGGTGLGLAIVKKLLELQGSTIELNSKPNEGAEFSFFLEFDHINPKKCKTASLTTAQSLGTAQILLVEDNAINALIAEKIISTWGPEVDIATNGKEALDKVKTKSYDLILMDIQMPVMDGNEATDHIRNLGGAFADIPILAMSASIPDNPENKPNPRGMDDFILKPFKPEELFGKLKEHLARKVRHRKAS